MGTKILHTKLILLGLGSPNMFISINMKFLKVSIEKIWSHCYINRNLVFKLLFHLGKIVLNSCEQKLNKQQTIRFFF